MISTLNYARWMKFLFVGCLLLGLLVGFFSPARALDPSPIVVNTSDDAEINDASCSLREAVTAAANNADYYGCVYLGQDVISLAASTYTVNSAIGINTGVTINGVSAASSIVQASACAPLQGSSCPHTHPVFTVAAGNSVVLNQLTIRHGVNGGIQNNGTLAITSSIVTTNYNTKEGGGVVNKANASLTISQSTISNNNGWIGGGIYLFSPGTLSINESTLSENSSAAGGGISTNVNSTSSTVINITKSTIAFNDGGNGGGIYNSGQLNITNSTISKNTGYTSGGGIYDKLGTLVMQNVTIGDNDTSSQGAAAGIYLNGTNLSMTNTIISNYTIYGYYTDCINNAATFTINNHNMVKDGTCNASLSGDPGLRSLQNNGGLTNTQEIAYSQAVDGGDASACPATDQRGTARPVGAGCDIGAYEAALPANLVVTVSTFSDEYSANSSCSIREAAYAIAKKVDFYGCVYTGRNEIYLPAGTYTLDTVMALNTKISGESAATTILQASACNPVVETCAHSHRVFNISYQDTATINNLTIRHGASGGVYVEQQAALTVTNSIITANKNTNYGGGIASYGTLVIDKSTISNNKSEYTGGGIYSLDSILTITNSTIAGNDAVHNGGGIFAGDSYSGTSTQTITNSTISGNHSNANGGGLAISSYHDVLNLTMINSTITGNSAGSVAGGAYLDAKSVITNTIIANSVSGADCSQGGSGILTSTNNLVEDGSCGVSITGDPLLGPLQDNGGPTQTHAFDYTFGISPALDSGDDTACPAADQRNVARPIGAACDIGAVEGAAPVDVNTTADVIANDSACSLREALAVVAAGVTANGCSYNDIDAIRLPEGTITLNSVLSVNTTATIAGRGPAKTILQASACDPTAGPCAHGHGLFEVQLAGELSLSNLTLRHAASSAVINSGSLNISSATITANTAAQGAAIYNLGSTILENSTLSANIAGSGGGILNAGSAMTIRTSTFSGNTASAEGGAISSSAPLVIETSTFSTNSANTTGGAVSSSASLSFAKSNLSANTAGSQGGAVYSTGSLTIETSTLNGNSASSHGGGILSAGILSLKTSTLSANTAGGSGGAIWGNDSLAIETSTLSANTATVDGGGVLSNAGLTIHNSTLANNSAGNSGGGLLANAALNLLHVTIYNNSASSGGGVHFNGDASIINTIIAASSNAGDCTFGAQSTLESINNLVQSGTCNATKSGAPYLGPLQNNGGLTLTMLPDLSPSPSPAFDAADQAHCLATDQRGSLRPYGDACDIGAVEAGLPVVVNTTLEGYVDDANCSLTEAAYSAMFSTSALGCTYKGSNVVALPAGVYTVSNGLLFDQSISIIGNSAADTIVQSTTCNPVTDISCVDATPLFQIYPGANVRLKGLTVRYAAPGIDNGGILTISDSIIRDNSAGIGAGLSNNVGAKADVSSSTFVGNMASSVGGGIYNAGTLNLKNSTLSGNSSSMYAGGLFNFDAATISNTTITGNTAAVATGGMFNLGSMSITNTIIANSSGGDCSIAFDTFTGTFGTNTHNLVEDGSCSAALSGDPLLGPLQNNGGTTPTHAFSTNPTSSVFNAGGSTCPGNDQRGSLRPQFGACDIGAYELLFSPTVLQTPANSTYSNNTSPTLTWAAAFGASKYKVHYRRQDLGPTESVTDAQTGLSWQAYFATQGNWLWWVESINADEVSLGISDVWTYSVDLTPPAVPALNSPANALLTRDNTPTVSWLTSTGASKYMTQFANNAAFTGPLTSAELTGLNFTPTARTDGTWYWRVRARDAAGNWSAYSSARSLVIDATAPAAPVLGSPANAGFTNDTTPTFSWLASTGASKYQLQYASSAAFTSVFTSPELATLTFTQATVLTQGLRYWHVRAMDAAGNWSAYSTARTFSIDTVAPLAPVLLAPANASRTSDRTPTFSWKASTGAASYQLCYSGSSTFVTSTCVLKKGVLTHTPPANLAAKTWYWRVRAQDAAGNWSAWSLKRTLIVQ